MKSFEAHTLIAADPQTVWDTQLNLQNWAAWDPNIVRAEGTLAVGGSITLHTKRPGEDKIRPFKLKVVEWYPPNRLVLAGGMPLGIFTGTQIHESTPSEGGTRFTIREQFTGLLSPLIARAIPDLQPGFHAYANGLKEAAEEQHRSGS
ncbi:MAG TPA: SRPBCC domain-containing protein [Propionibacteriaceae bacterium]|jgi:hypothetical protein